MPAPITVVTATAAPASISLTATAVRTYKPTDDSDYLLPDIKITKIHHGGTCDDSSIAIGTAGFRCFASDNNVLDPCFPTFVSGSEVAICITAPWLSQVQELIPSSVLPTLRDNGDSLSGNPEWIQLATGEHCGSPTGARDEYQGQPITYYCDHNKAVVGNLGGQGKLRTAGVVTYDSGYRYKWVGDIQVAVEWLPKADTTEPSSPQQSLYGAAIAEYIRERTGDGSAQCPETLPITVGANYTCGGNGVTYTITILTNDGEYTISYS